MILGAVIFGAAGIACMVLGYLIWKKEKIIFSLNFMQFLVDFQLFHLL